METESDPFLGKEYVGSTVVQYKQYREGYRMRIFHEILRWINFYFAAGGKLEYN